MNNEFTGNMDLLDGYDRAMTATKHKLGDAMLYLAHLKYIDPYSSVSCAGFKPTPICRVVTEYLELQWQRPYFNNYSLEDEEYEQEQQIVEELQKEFDKNGEILMENRFGTISHHGHVLQTKKCFEEALQYIMKMAQKAKEINKMFANKTNIKIA